MRIAICFLTTNKDSFNLQKLIDQANNSKLHQVDIYEYVDTVTFDFNDLRKKFNWPHIYINNTSSVGIKESTMHLAWLDMYSNHKGEYDMYLFTEDDVSYFGDANFFDTIDFECDTIFSHERMLMTDHSWNWNYSKNKLDKEIIKDHFHGLCNIYGFKGYLIDEFIEFIKDGNHAHWEWLVSSFALNKDIDIHYISHYMKVWCSWKRNDIPNSSFYDLIHPIKTIKDYETYANRRNSK